MSYTFNHPGETEWRDVSDGYPGRGRLVEIRVGGETRQASWDEPSLMMWTDASGEAWYHPIDVREWRPLGGERPLYGPTEIASERHPTEPATVICTVPDGRTYRMLYRTEGLGWNAEARGELSHLDGTCLSDEEEDEHDSWRDGVALQWLGSDALRR